jgi:hypothetical protein
MTDTRLADKDGAVVLNKMDILIHQEESEMFHIIIGIE